MCMVQKTQIIILFFIIYRVGSSLSQAAKPSYTRAQKTPLLKNKYTEAPLQKQAIKAYLWFRQEEKERGDGGEGPGTEKKSENASWQRANLAETSKGGDTKGTSARRQESIQSTHQAHIQQKELAWVHTIDLTRPRQPINKSINQCR